MMAYWSLRTTRPRIPGCLVLCAVEQITVHLHETENETLSIALKINMDILVLCVTGKGAAKFFYINLLRNFLRFVHYKHDGRMDVYMRSKHV